MMDEVILAQLSPKIRLVATEKAFILVKKVKDKKDVYWKRMYYYSNLGEALQGFVRYITKLPLLGPGKVPKIKKLIKRIKKLDKKISEIEKKWEEQFKELPKAVDTTGNQP
jgi:hypothetical protein